MNESLHGAKVAIMRRILQGSRAFVIGDIRVRASVKQYSHYFMFFLNNGFSEWRPFPATKGKIRSRGKITHAGIHICPIFKQMTHLARVARTNSLE